jgi:sialic acid synthase SpsE
MGTVQLGKRTIGEDNPVLIIAECGINHNNSLDMALEMIDAAAEAGADAAKFQFFRAPGIYTPAAGMYKAAKGDMFDIYELLESVELPEEWLPDLSAQCRKCDIEFIMTVCDEWCADQMEKVEFSSYKTASGEISHLPLLAYVASKGKPMIVSTGASTIADVVEAVSAVAPEGSRPIGLVQCETAYPAKMDELNLRVIGTYARLFPNVIPGFSDHTVDAIRAPVQAVYHGAKIVEKHFTLDRKLPGADHSFAVDPPDLMRTINAVREAEEDVAAGRPLKIDEELAGDGVRRISKEEELRYQFYHRTILTVKPIAAGEPLTCDNIACLRNGEAPGGLHTRYYGLLASGKYAATRPIAQHTGVVWDDVLSAAE